ASLAAVPSASAVLKGGLITYNNQMKSQLLDVPADLIKREGPVSEPVAKAMAQGCLEKTGADLAASITGLAGPSGGRPDLPVGRVWLATAARDLETQAHVYDFSGNRQQVQILAAYRALDLMRRRLIDL
ncbi:MAG TPA: nicotinamide-nucleotide amidohydrolase family protein, partial [Clostridia bacterium]|nr:nicotinamide-nucleotide amidohydrolase family protein [Clostridia bacterium]